MAGGLLAAVTGSVCAQPIALRGLQLIDHRGAPLDAATLRGRPVLLHHLFTACSTTCPTQVQELAQLWRDLPPAVRERATLLSVTVDPLSDSPQRLSAFARSHRIDLPGWRLVSGEPREVFALLDRLQSFDRRTTRPQPSDHRTQLFLFDARGELVQRFLGVPVDRPRLARELAAATHTPSSGAQAQPARRPDLRATPHD